MFMYVIKYYGTAKHKVGDKHINQCLSPTLLIFALFTPQIQRLSAHPIFRV